MNPNYNDLSLMNIVISIISKNIFLSTGVESSCYTLLHNLKYLSNTLLKKIMGTIKQHNATPIKLL